MAQNTVTPLDGMAILRGMQMVMEEIGAIGKNQRNDQQRFMFRGIDDVMNALHPLLAKAHIIIIPHVLDVQRDERLTSDGKRTLLYSIAKIKFDFMSTEDGSMITTEVVGEGMDSGDKSMNKAMSIALKYAAFQVFCIPTEEMIDPDKESHEVAPRQAPQGHPQWFVDACKVKAGDTTLGKLYKVDPATFYGLKETGTDEQKKAIGLIENYMGGAR